MIDLTIPKTIEFLTLEFHTYGLIIGLSLAIIYTKLQKYYKNDHYWLLFLFQTLVSVVAGRLTFTLLNFEVFYNDPQNIFRLDLGGISIFGVLAGFLLSSYLVSKYIDTTFIDYSDKIASILPLSQAIGRLGNFVNGELFGPPTTLFWGISVEKASRPEEYITSDYFHPLFLYEAILSLLNFFTLKIVKTKYQINVTGLYLINYGFIRIVMNRLRLDQNQVFGFITDQDILAIILIIAGVLILRRANRPSGLVDYRQSH